MKTIGIVGGMGPMATVWYLEWITRLTDADCDQEHPRVLLKSVPDTPDRTAYILGQSRENPLPVLEQSAKELIQAGADFITIPCITAHYFREQLEDRIGKPVLSMPEEVARRMSAAGVKKAGILATTGTLKSGVLEREFRAVDIDIIVPDERLQGMVMEIIYGQIKKGKRIDWEMFSAVSEALFEKGAEKLVLGCTELPLVQKERQLGDAYVDVLKVLAQKAVIESGARLKKEC
ncbi:MAG: amino acid racemase [Clostridiaceae bacterium]|nr:amino acid racemase [Clostridiaceae bacterium]